eukprot:8353942-Alexandrium_andersonii.AAC.1
MAHWAVGSFFSVALLFAGCAVQGVVFGCSLGLLLHARPWPTSRLSAAASVVYCALVAELFQFVATDAGGRGGRAASKGWRPLSRRWTFSAGWP